MIDAFPPSDSQQDTPKDCVKPWQLSHVVLEPSDGPDYTTRTVERLREAYDIVKHAYRGLGLTNAELAGLAIQLANTREHIRQNRDHQIEFMNRMESIDTSICHVAN